MALTKPVVAVGRARLRVLGPDRVFRGNLSGADASWNWSKSLDGAALQFVANFLEPALASDPDLLEDAFAIVQLDTPSGWVSWGTPYALAPGAGQVVSGAEGSAREQTPVSVGALQALLSELIVLPTECDEDAPTFRKTGGTEANRYVGWTSKGYQTSLHPGTWHLADIYTPDTGTSIGTATVEESDDSFTLTAHGLEDGERVRLEIVSGAAGVVEGIPYEVSVADADHFSLSPAAGGQLKVTTDGSVTVYAGLGPKYAEPLHWDEAADEAEFVYRDADGEGSLVLYIFGTITLAERTTVKVIWTGDESGKVYVDGPNGGGVLDELYGDETGYTEKGSRRIRLEAGVHRFCMDHTIVGSVGGDGNDSVRFAVGTIDDKGRMAEVLLMSGADTLVRRQEKGDERPGMSPMESWRRLVAECASVAPSSCATDLLDDADFTDSLDSAGNAPAPEDCVEIVAPLGMPLSSVAVDAQVDVDWNYTTGFVWQLFLDRGVDRGATPAVGESTVQLKTGAGAAANLLDYSWNSDPAGPTRYLTLSQDGFDMATVSTIEDAQARPRFGFFETGASASIARAKKNARVAIRQTGAGGRRYYRARCLAVEAAHTPGVDDAPADVVLALDFEGADADLESTDIGGEQNEAAVVFTYDLTAAA